MNRFRMYVKRAVVGTAAGVMAFSMSAAAAPVDDLNEILTKQAESVSEQPTPLSDYLGWTELKAAAAENGVQTGLKLTIPETLTETFGLPEELAGSLGLDITATVDQAAKQWALDLSALSNDSSILNVNLYADQDQLTLAIPEFLSYAVGLKSGSFAEQYQGSGWEELFGELDLSNDINLTFFPEIATEDTSEADDLLAELRSILESDFNTASAQLQVETREEDGATLYDVTYDTESLLAIYRDVLTKLVDTLDQSALVDMSNVDDFYTSLDQVMDQVKVILGDSFVLTYWVEDDLVNKISMDVTFDPSKLSDTEYASIDTSSDGEDETEETETTEAAEESAMGRIAGELVYKDPENVAAGGTLTVDLYADAEDAEPTDVYECNFVRETTDTTANFAASMKLTDEGEVLYDEDLFSMTFDASTGEAKVSVNFPTSDNSGELTIVGSNLDCVFENVTAGKAFTLKLKDMSITQDGASLSIGGGEISVNVDFTALTAPEGTQMLGDMDSNAAMMLVLEGQSNIQTWLEDLGLIEEETEVSTVE